jgi:hypothetical protein
MLCEVSDYSMSFCGKMEIDGCCMGKKMEEKDVYDLMWKSSKEEISVV